MSGFPANVIRLDDRRPFALADDDLELEFEPVQPRRHLRLVQPEAAVFRLDTFLARAQIVMAEMDGDPAAAAVLPLHARHA